MTTTIPSTDEKVKTIKREDTFWCCTFNFAAICASLYGIIFTLLLSLTVRGPIGGQYGVLIIPNANPNKDPSKLPYDELLTLTDMPVALEVFLISLLFIGHLMCFISVIKEWARGLLFFFFFRIGEIFLCFCWFCSVFGEHIKSHLMSQNSLRWYCLFALIIELICVCLVPTAYIAVNRKEKTKNPMGNYQVPWLFSDHLL